jgi:nucleoid-associated protein YgaU
MMMKNPAIWVALIVIAVAAHLMFFVVLPQTRGDKTAEELAGKAGETVDQAKTAVDQAAADPKAAIIGKMARLKTDGEAATTEFEALFADNKLPTVEQVAAARARLEAVLKGASTVEVPQGLDAATAAVVSKTSEIAKKALAALDAMPTDAAGAKKAFDSIKATTLAMLDGAQAAGAVVAPAKDQSAKVEEVKPADDAKAVKPVDTAQTAEGALPSFDVLRVEPDGSTVIAGHASPGARVDIVDGDKVIATAKAGESGDFVAVLDNPLPAGDHQLVLRATARDGAQVTSVEVATVAVPANKSGELLAMVTKPGEASRIMAMPEANPEANKETVVADNGANQATKDVTAEPAADVKQAIEAKPADAAKAEDTTVATPELPAGSKDIAEQAPVAGEQAPVASDTAQAASKDASNVASADTAFDAGQAADAGQKPVVAKAKPEVQVSAVEIEGSKIFIAGSARPKAVVRLYADDRLVAETSADESGRFVGDNTMPLTVGNHTIRADVLSADGKKVEFRASVPFFRPEGEQLAAVAGDDTVPQTKLMQPLADGAYDKARNEAGKAVSLLKGLYEAGKTPSMEELAAARSATEFALKTLSQIKLADNVDPVAKEMATKTAGEAAKALLLLKSLPQDANAVRTALASIDDAVTSAVAPPLETASADEAPVVADKPKPADASTVESSTEVADSSQAKAKANKVETGNAADAGSQSTAPLKDAAKPDQDVAAADVEDSQPKMIEQAPLKASQASVIIRRGDTLWQISRRVYGLGVRYTTIYVANEDQIADPDRIMPGQIFGVPDKYLPNSEELHRERMDHKKH